MGKQDVQWEKLGSGWGQSGYSGQVKLVIVRVKAQLCYTLNTDTDTAFCQDSAFILSLVLHTQWKPTDAYEIE